MTIQLMIKMNLVIANVMLALLGNHLSLQLYCSFSSLSILGKLDCRLKSFLAFQDVYNNIRYS